MLKMLFNNEVAPLLKGYIRHYWYVYSNATDFYSENILLPMDHVDLLFTLGDEYVYDNRRIIKPDRIHFHGIRNHPVKVTQRGKPKSIGISFTPWGFYFFAKQPMSQFVNKIINFSDINYPLWNELSYNLNQFEEFSQFVKLIEKSFIKHLNVTKKEQLDCRIIEEFLKEKDTNITEFCKNNRVSSKKLERIFKKYIGINAKGFKQIIRFEESSKDVLYNSDSSLTDISYKHGYYDQAHFSKVFKNYTHYSPRNFQSDKPAMKSHMTFDSDND